MYIRHLECLSVCLFVRIYFACKKGKFANFYTTEHVPINFMGILLLLLLCPLMRPFIMLSVRASVFFMDSCPFVSIVISEQLCKLAKSVRAEKYVHLLIVGLLLYVPGKPV